MNEVVEVEVNLGTPTKPNQLIKIGPYDAILVQKSLPGHVDAPFVIMLREPKERALKEGLLLEKIEGDDGIVRNGIIYNGELLSVYHGDAYWGRYLAVEE